MAKVGRNDPCPCGSGKKYKHCCLRKETTSKSQALGRERAWGTMMDKLLDFSREDRFRPDLESAFDLFWNKSYTAEEIDALDPMQVMSFLDWHVHDYRTSNDAQRMIDLFYAERGPDLSEQELEALEAARDSVLSAYEVIQVEEWKSVSLRDVFQDVKYELPYTSTVEGIRVGQLLLGRLVVAGQIRRFSWIAMVVPPEVEEEFKEYIQDMYAKYQEERYQASWKEFLRERSYLFNHFMLKVRGKLPPPRVFVPSEEEKEMEPRPAVLTPEHVKREERPSVLVPGQKGAGPPRRVLLPGRDD